MPRAIFSTDLGPVGAQLPNATFPIKRKWPKKGAALGFHSSITPVAARPRASLSLPRESDKERPGSPPGPRAGRQPSSGGCRPGPPAVRGGVRASTGPRVGLALPGAQLQGGGRQPSPPAVRGGIWASATPWLGWLLPREAGLRRQGRHPRKANTERRSGRGTRAGGVIPFRFCCPAAI